MYNVNMAKEYKVQKKKTLARQISDIIFKILVAIAVIIFAYIAYDKVDFGTTSVTFNAPKKTKQDDHTPSELRWFDTFKGIENVPNKNDKKNSNSNGGNGFRYEGFKK